MEVPVGDEPIVVLAVDEIVRLLAVVVAGSVQHVPNAIRLFADVVTVCGF